MSVDITLNGTTYEGVESVSVDGNLFVLSSDSEWTDITPDLSTWHLETTNGSVDVANGVITLTSTGVGWNLAVTSRPNLYTYGLLHGKNVRCSFDYTLNGFTSGKGITGSLATYSASAATASVRTSYVSDDDNEMYINTDGAGSFTTTVPCDENGMATEKFSGSRKVTDYVGVSIFLNANSGAVATLSNLKIEVQNL